MKTTIEQLPLTPKQQLFCDEYLKDLNATRAALRAGYSGAMALSGKLMQLPKIKAYIKHRTKKTASKMEIVRNDFLTELCRIAFANMGDYFDDDGKMKPMNQLTSDQKAAIWNIKMTENDKGSTLQLRLNNKLGALEKIAKHLGFYYAVAEEPEVKYVYLDKEEIDENDRIEDETMAPPKAEKTSEVGSQMSENDDEDGDAKNGRWERDKALYMEQELERLKKELQAQKQRASAEAEADGDKDWLARNKKVTEDEEVAVAGGETVGVAATVETEQKTEPAKPRFFANMGLTGKIVSKEVRKERRRDFEYATGIKLPGRYGN